MRDFRLRHVNRGESRKQPSRRAQAKFHSGATTVLGVGGSPLEGLSEEIPSSFLNTPTTSTGNSRTVSRNQSRTQSPTRAVGVTAEQAVKSEDESERPVPGRQTRKVGKSKLSSEVDTSAGALNIINSSDDEGDDYALAIPSTQWQIALNESIESLLDRRKAKANQAMREKYLATVLYILRHVHASELALRVNEFVPALLRSAKTQVESEQKEAQLALEVLCAVAVTVESEAQSHALFTSCRKKLIQLLSVTPSNLTKSWIVTALGVLAYYGRVPRRTLVDSILPFFAEIVSSDGKSVNATDSAEVVAAAEEMWTFVCTRTGISRDETGVTDAVEAFLDQLDSTDANVQIVAGEGLAAVYELSYARKQDEADGLGQYDSDFEDGEDAYEYQVPGGDDEGSLAAADNQAPSAADHDDPAVMQCKKHFTQVFPPLPNHQFSQMLDSVKGLSRVSTKNISADTRRRLRSTFSDVYNSLSRHPVLGPRYQTSVDWETGRERGSRTMITLGGEDLAVRHWWQWVRWQVLRSVLKNGVAVHYLARNANVVDSLKKAPPSARTWSGVADDEEDEEAEYVEEDEGNWDDE